MGPGAEAGGAAGNGVDTATRGAFGFLVFMMVLNVLNILDRQLLPTFGPEIKADLGPSLPGPGHTAWHPSVRGPAATRRHPDDRGEGVVKGDRRDLRPPDR